MYLTPNQGSTASVPQPATEYSLACLFGDEEAGDDNDPVDDVPGVSPATTKSTIASSPTSPFLTKQDLLDIRSNIAATIRPSWQAALPGNFGCAEHGKLKADQWRTALEFDLPVSLVKILFTRRKTGNITDDMRAQRIVEHTMDLAIAMAWGLSRRTSTLHAERYQFYMTRYVKGIHELYPGYDLKPKHHYALHIPEILLQYGPIRGTWAFGLERMIGRLQKLNSNHKIGNILSLSPNHLAKSRILGEMELTVMKTFCRRSNLVSFLSCDESPPLLKQAWASMQKRIKVDDLDSASSSEQGSASVKSKGSQYGALDTETHCALIKILSCSRGLDATSGDGCISQEALFHGHIQLGGILYSDFHTNLNHSIIYARRNAGADAPSVPAQIRSIFTHKHRDTKNQLIEDVFLAIHEYVPSDNTPFIAFPDFRAAIFHREPASAVQVIRSKQVHCHANQMPWDRATVVMRAVDRVRSRSLFHIAGVFSN